VRVLIYFKHFYSAFLGSVENLISFVHLLNLFHRYRIGGCNSSGGAGKYLSPQERYENLFLSISIEPFFPFIRFVFTPDSDKIPEK
jgi:hypothetical protein